MDDETRDENPRPVIVRGVKAEPEDVVVLDVEHPGGELEEDAADQHQQRQPFHKLRDRPQRWPGEQPRNDRPEFGQHDRDDDQTQPDVQTLGEAV